MRNVFLKTPKLKYIGKKDAANFPYLTSECSPELKTADIL